MSKLDASDVDGLTDLADRTGRAARTARATAAADPEAATMLTDLAERAEGLVFAAEALAIWVEAHRR